MTEYTISKIDVAVEQLDWSIKLLIDHKAYVPAITLAGAAEEVLGETLGDNSIFALLKTKLAKDYELSEKSVSQDYLNKAKNWIKHWKDTEDDKHLNIDLETAALQYIIRALGNLLSYDSSLPSEGPRFFKWLQDNRGDLYNS